MTESNFEKKFPKISDKIPVTERSVRSRADRECQREGYLCALRWARNEFVHDPVEYRLVGEEIEAVEQEKK